MPRPGQPGSLDVFTGNNVSDYLYNYNAECELYVKAEHRAITRFPLFCTPEIKEIVTLLPGYESLVQLGTPSKQNEEVLLAVGSSEESPRLPECAYLKFRWTSRQCLPP
jgi:hypothetical protein